MSNSLSNSRAVTATRIAPIADREVLDSVLLSFDDRTDLCGTVTVAKESDRGGRRLVTVQLVLTIASGAHDEAMA